MEAFMFCQVDMLSPSQCATQFPDPRNVDRDTTIDRFPNISRTALQIYKSRQGSCELQRISIRLHKSG